MAKKIYLSPANHDGQNVCKYKSTCRETIHCRSIALAAQKYLEANGFLVKVRKTMQNGKILSGQTMAKAVAEANKWGADLYIPIHTNASSDSATRYFMMMTLDKTQQKYKKLYNTIGKAIQQQYQNALKEAGYAAKSMVWSARPDLYEIDMPEAITCYLEMGFHTNKTVDVMQFIHKDEGAYAGKAIAKGVCAYYGVTFKDPDEAQPDQDPNASQETAPPQPQAPEGDFAQTDPAKEETTDIQQEVHSALGGIVLAILAGIIVLLTMFF